MAQGDEESDSGEQDFVRKGFAKSRTNSASSPAALTGSGNAAAAAGASDAEPRRRTGKDAAEAPSRRRGPPGPVAPGGSVNAVRKERRPTMVTCT